METPLDLRPYQLAIVIGVDPKIQYFVPGIAPKDPRTKLRLRFNDFLRDIIARYPVDAICEQAQHGVESIAQTVAEQERLRYRNIEIPPRRRAELGIPPLDTTDVPGSEITPEQLARWNALRESHMVQELLGAVAGARAMIVICGVSHMPSGTAPFVLPAPPLVKRSAKKVLRKRDAGVTVFHNDHPDGSGVASRLSEARGQLFDKPELVVVAYRLASFLLRIHAFPDLNVKLVDFITAQHDQRTEGPVCRRR
jgi:hypothetical protein